MLIYCRSENDTDSIVTTWVTLLHQTAAGNREIKGNMDVSEHRQILGENRSLAFISKEQ